MTHPTVFISHRHADAKVARIVADFLKRNSAGNVCVQLSSSADYGHPGVGERLVPTLKRHLAVSDVVVLIFTAEGPGWSWCMWECGVATDPHDDTSTKVVVLQCGDDVPAPYADQLRIDARELEPLTGFVKQVLATNDLFPHHDRPISGYAEADPELRELAATLHADLADAIVGLQAPAAQERWASTYVCIELDKDAVADLETAEPAAAARLIAERGCIVEKQGASALFGRHVCIGERLEQLPIGIPPVPGRARWFDALVEQIRTAVAGRYPMVPWAPFSVEPSKAVIPYVAGVRTVPATGAVRALVYFVPMSPRPVPVIERMIERGSDVLHRPGRPRRASRSASSI